jgi:hypothetical protein
VVKGDAEVGMVNAIGAFSTYGMDHVGLGDRGTLTGQSCYRDLSCVIPEYELPAAAPTKQTSHERSVKKERLESVFTGAALSIIKPTVIYTQPKFKEVWATCSTKFDLTHPKLSVRALLNGVKTVNISIGICTPIKLGILLEVYRDIIESLYVNRGR